jgi:hypothetical protein
MRIGRSCGLRQSMTGVLCLSFLPVLLAAGAYAWEATLSESHSGLTRSGLGVGRNIQSGGSGVRRPVVMLYRAQDAKGVSRLGYAESSDGIRFTRRPDPVLVPETEYEMGGGVEDPRIVKLGISFA